MQLTVEVEIRTARTWVSDLRDGLVAASCGLLGAIVAVAATGDIAGWITLWLFEGVARWIR